MSDPLQKKLKCFFLQDPPLSRPQATILVTHTGEKPYQNLEMAIFAMVLRRHKPCFFWEAPTLL